MKFSVALAVSCVMLLFTGCNKTETSKPYTPKELTAEEAEFKQQLSAYSAQFKTALGKPGDYVQIAILDRHATFPEMDETPVEYTCVLVLHREVLDLDDYGLSLPGKEASEDEADYIPGFFGELMFWIDKDANIIFDEGEQPPGTDLVVEWCIPNNVGDQVSLHFGGIPCLTIDLSE